MKKIITALSLLLILSMSLLLSGCGFFEESTGMMIESIDVKEQDDGSTKIIINFTDEYLSPKEFIIPKGEEGKKGAGIDDIIVAHNDSEARTEIVIFYDDNSQSAPFYVPDGKTITDVGAEKITETIDGVETERYELVFYFNDDTTISMDMPPICQIQDITDPITDSAGNINVDIIWGVGDGSDSITSITIPKGEQGDGIASMTAEDYTDDETGKDYYVIKVTYTNETMGAKGDGTDEFYLEKPEKPADPNQWHTGAEPENPRVGDFWFYDAEKTIYLRKENGWDPVISFMKLAPSYYTVSFYLNDGTPEGSLEAFTQAYITPGNCFATVGFEKDLPIPTRDGYTFKGWYTVERDPNPAINQPFTDLTYVNSDLKLYAIWELNSQ